MRNEFNKLIERVEMIENDSELTTKFRKIYATDFNVIKASIKANLIKEEAIEFIKELTKNYKGIMEIISKDVKLSVGEHEVLCDIGINKDGNLEILWKEDIEKLFPDGYCTEGYNDEIILYPYKTKTI
jgi:hypothetical protein